MSSLPSRDEVSRFDRTQLVAKLCSTFAELNYIHAFREGNGRTQRIFLQTIALASSHDLNWDVITRDRMLHGSIAACEGNPGPVARLFNEATDPLRIAEMKKAIGYLKSNIPATWNDQYVATTVEGQSYSGEVVAVGSTNFLMLVNEQRRKWIGVGKPSDVDQQNLQPEDQVDYEAQSWKP
jgi:hypothetical protein